MALESSVRLQGGAASPTSTAVLAEGRLLPEDNASHAKWLKMRQEWVVDCSPGRHWSDPFGLQCGVTATAPPPQVPLDVFEDRRFFFLLFSERDESV